MALPIKLVILPRIMEKARGEGLLSPDSSSMVAAYQISRYWRELFLKATREPSMISPLWNEKEVAAAKIILSSFIYLEMEGCKNIEGLINQVSKADKLFVDWLFK